MVLLQVLYSESLVRGAGAPVAKSAKLLSVSLQPFWARNSASELAANTDGAVSEKLAVGPKPSISTMLVVTGTAPLSCTLSLTSASLPVVPDICSKVPGTTNGAGKPGNVLVALLVAPWNNTYWPGATVKSASADLIQVPVPPADAYCRLQPLAVTDVVPRLKISM